MTAAVATAATVVAIAADAVVTSAPELVERLGLTIPELEEEPLPIYHHARWVRSLARDLQHQIDRALFELAPPAKLDGEPLISVRIPTFGSVDLLMSRAIPSVLTSHYENFELLVCSDGPQPHAREAVERAGEQFVGEARSVVRDRDGRGAVPVGVLDVDDDLRAGETRRVRQHVHEHALQQLRIGQRDDIVSVHVDRDA